MGAFRNDLRVGHLKESLPQNIASSMKEIIAHAKCYIEGEKSNAQKKVRDIKV